MTSLLRSEAGAFLYAQALDNEGDPEYWWLPTGGASPERIDLADERAVAVRELIDDVQANSIPRQLRGGLYYRRQKPGAFVITVKPETLDADGRVSPVLAVFPDFNALRDMGERAVQSIEIDLGRRLSVPTRHAIARLSKVLVKPPCLARAFLYLQSSRVGDD